MRYTAKPIIVEAVLLDCQQTGLNFLKCGEFSAILADGSFYIVVPGGTILAPLGDCYLIRWPNGVDIMDRTEFETMYEEAL